MGTMIFAADSISSGDLVPGLTHLNSRVAYRPKPNAALDRPLDFEFANTLVSGAMPSDPMSASTSADNARWSSVPAFSSFVSRGMAGLAAGPRMLRAQAPYP